jgi:SpoIID/LytB domain protein
MRVALAAGCCLLAAGVAAAADVERTVAEAYSTYRAGRYDDAASAWRYLQSLGVSAPKPEANAALVEREADRPEAAMALWIKASLLDAGGGFAWNQRGWTALALERTREGRESFEKAVDRSTSSAVQAEAELGLGMAALQDGKPKAALEALRRASVAGPYAVAVAAQLTAEAAMKLGDRQSALTYLRQSLDVDPFNREALRSLMILLNQIGDNRGAWLTARRALALDAADGDARRISSRNAGFLTGDPDGASGVRRIARPVLNADSDEAVASSTRTIRVGLYGGPDGRPATMSRCYLMMNSAFKVTAAAYGVMRDNGNAFNQWEIEYRPETAVVEVRDSARNLLFVSKQPFSFVPNSAHGSVLVKSAKINDPVGVDLGDRELRGAVEVIPNPWGFRLVSESPLDSYLYGVVSLALPDNSPPEAYKAQAVVSRTAALWAASHRAATLERVDLLDDRSVQQTIGVSGEMRSGKDGVVETSGLVLSENGFVGRAPQHADSGGRTEDGTASGEPGMAGLRGAVDGPGVEQAWATPVDLERFVHETPPEGLYSEAAVGSTPANARWMRLFDAKDLRARAEGKKKIGRLRALRVLSRTATGRVTSLEAIGESGTAEFNGFAEIQQFLSPGSLRSTLFTLQPLYDGKHLSRVIAWGAGTGTGLGFSRAGALGQAALGRGWRDILKVYFPTEEVLNVDHPKAAAVPARGPQTRYRTLNFRNKK